MKKFLRLPLLIGLFALAGVTNATVLALPGANEMSVGVYNSFNVYSLELLQKCSAAGDPRCGSGAGLPVQSSPGQIKDELVILGASKGLKNTDGPAAPGDPVDEPFDTPAGGTSSFAISDAGGGFVGDQVNRWDVSLSLLNQYLNGNDLVFLFDNNQSGAGQNQWLDVWGQVRIVDAAGNTINGLCFELSSGAGCSPTGPTPTNDYIPIIGNFCVNKVSGASYNIGTAQNQGDCGVQGYFINNNLGQNNAEFAVYNQLLDAAVRDAANGAYFLSVDVRYLNNGGGNEQLWICSQCTIPDTPVDMPEPATLPLMLMGFAAAGVMIRRARTTKQ